MSESTCSASSLLIGWPLRLAKAVTRMRAPSSSRMLSLTWVAMNSRTSSGTATRSCSALVWRMASRVSSSGGCTSVIRPDRNRLRSLSSRVAMDLGGRSEVRTICLEAPYRELKVWKNSSWSDSLRSMNCTSSISSTSHSRYRRLKAVVVLVLMAWANRLEEAMTKVSKVYRGSSTGESRRPVGPVGGDPKDWSWWELVGTDWADAVEGPPGSGSAAERLCSAGS